VSAGPLLNTAKEDAMGITAMALGLMLLTLGAGCLLWILLLHFEEFYPAAKDGILHPRSAGLLFRALTGLTTLGILAVLVLEFKQLVPS
jgi:hypothetical protein